MYVNVTFDSSVANAPAGFKACVNAVCQYYDAMFTNAVAISVNVGWGEVGGQAIDAGALGESSSAYIGQSYAQVAAALRAQGAPGSATLPQNSPASGTLDVTTAQALALGLGNFGQGNDGSIGIDASARWFIDPTQSQAVPFSSYDMMGVIEHELSEVMGRSSNLDQARSYSVLDLYRYASNGVRQLTTGDPSYFSIDSGKTLGLAFNNYQTGQVGGDLGDWAATIGSPDSYGDGLNGQIGPVSATDKVVMAAIGWTTTAASTGLNVAAAVPTLSAAAAVAAINEGVDNYVSISDSGANVSAQLDALEQLASNETIYSIGLSSSPTITLSLAQMSADGDALGMISGSYRMAVADSAADIAANLATLETDVMAGKVTGIQVTDATFTDISLSSAQFSGDAAALAVLTGNYFLTIDATSGSNLSITGLAGHGNIVALSGTASQYTITPGGDGISFTVSSSTIGTDHLSGITALEFGSSLDIVAATPGKGTVTTGNITELYGAVFDRQPDVPGLAFYLQYLQANPSTPLVQFAQYFLASPEYTGNTTHNYAHSQTGDDQFITDSYENLLHRAPETGAIPFYENVIDSYTKGLAAGSAAYIAAENLGHAWVLTYFSASPEFLNDVQITAAHPADAQHWLYLI
jgi:hypothetical protein